MGESTIFGMTTRGALALIITLSCCSIAIWTKDIGVLKDLAFLVLGFYFGQKPTSTLGGSNASQTTTAPAVPVVVKPAEPVQG